METTVNAELIDACRQKQRDFVEEDADKAFAEVVYQDMLNDMRREEEREMLEYDDEHRDMFDCEVRRLPLSEARKAELRAQGKETPDEYKARRARVAREKVERAKRVEEDKEVKKAREELPVVAKPTLEFRLALQQARQVAKMTQETLASKCGVKKSVVADWEAGRAPVPPAKMTIIKRVLKM
jgi:DNA-binding transcriptional regulator YiaG